MKLLHKNNALTVGAVKTFRLFKKQLKNMSSLLYHKIGAGATESEDFVKENFVMTTNIPEMLGVKEIAERFGISQNYARQLALSGAVKAVRVGKGKILINAQSLSEYFNSNYINALEPVQTTEIKPISVNL